MPTLVKTSEYHNNKIYSPQPISVNERHYDHNPTQNDHQYQRYLHQQFRNAHHNRQRNTSQYNRNSAKYERGVYVSRVIIPGRGGGDGVGEFLGAVGCRHGCYGGEVSPPQEGEDWIAASRCLL